MPTESCKERDRGGTERTWEDNITEWPGKALSDNLRWADRERWHELVANTVMPLRSRRPDVICKKKIHCAYVCKGGGY